MILREEALSQDHMKICRLVILLTLTGFATACVTIDTVKIPKESVPNSKEEAAYLMGTLAVKTEGDDYAPNGLYSLKFRSVGGSESGALNFSQTDLNHTPIAYKTSDSKGGIFVASLRPGDYEFHNVHFIYPGPLVHYTFSAKRDFSIPFTLKSGRVLYVGELTATGVWGKNALQYVPIGGYFARSNQIWRDKQLIEAAHPEIKGLSIDILPIEKEAPPFVIAK
jgi:hypothetical protein